MSGKVSNSIVPANISLMPKISSCANCSDNKWCVDCKISHYVRLCNVFGTSVDPSVVSTITTNWDMTQVVARGPTDASLLPFVFTLPYLSQLKSMYIGTHVSYSYRGDGNWICRSLSPGLSGLPNLRTLDLQRLGIDGRGLNEVADAIAALPKLIELVLRHNYLGYYSGTDGLVTIVKDASKTLRFIDISCNSLGYWNVRRIQAAAEESRHCPVDLHIVEDEPRTQPRAGDSPRMAVKASPKARGGHCCYEIDVEGNFVVEEVWNSVLHGIGALLGIIGTWDLTNKAKGQTDQVWWACLVYGLSATTLFIASTLYHSTFLHERARRVFQMLDHCAIFFLIAGTYTPIGLIALSSIPSAVLMVTIEWVIAFLGIAIYLVSAHFPRLVKSLPYVIYEVVLYTIMGHMCLISYEAIIVEVEPHILFTLGLGGLLYVVGVVFFILEQLKKLPILHCVWHVFVLAAAICHFFSVRAAVVSRLYDSAHSAAAMAAAPQLFPGYHFREL